MPEADDGRPDEPEEPDQPDDPAAGATGHDAFDDIVSRLGLDLPFPDDADATDRARRGRRYRRHDDAASSREHDDPQHEPEPEPEPFELDEQPDAVDEQFYRRVEPRAARPMHRGRVAAWAGLVGAPLLLMIASLSGRWLSSAVLLGAALTFVASAIYLIAQLPEHGPSQRDWPDDGAAL